MRIKQIKYYFSMKSEKKKNSFSDAALTTTKKQQSGASAELFRDAPIVQFSQRIITPTNIRFSCKNDKNCIKNVEKFSIV